MPKYPTEKAGLALAKHLGVDGKVLVRNPNPLEVLREYVSYRKTPWNNKRSENG